MEDEPLPSVKEEEVEEIYTEPLPDSEPINPPSDVPSSSSPVEEILNNDLPPSSRNSRPVEHEEPTSSADSQFFECNICYDPVRQPVVTLCGHLYCWPCIYRWLEQSPSCPVCKAGASKDKLVPIYGRSSEGNITADPRETIPERPAGQRPDPIPPRHPFENFFQPPFSQTGISFSAGFTPFGFQMQWPNTPNVPLSEQQQHQLFVSRTLFVVGIAIFFILFWI